LNSFKTLVKRVEIRLDLPCLSSDGGLLALRKSNERLGLSSRMASCLTDRRKDGSLHSQEKMLAQRVFGIAMGWEDCNDFDTLKDDPLYTHVLGGKPATQPTLSRFENGVRRKDLMRASLELVGLFTDRHRASPPRRIVIDMDATEDPAHGQQEFEFYHGHYGKHCFLPLLVFCSVDGQDEELVGAILRPGNVHAGRRSASILRRLVSMLKLAFPECELVFRGDAGFALPEMYEACEDLNISYLISLGKNSRLLEMAAPLIQSAREERNQTKTTARHFGELSYAAQTWSKERRVIVKAEAMEKGDNPRFVVTNLIGTPEELYAEYCRRGDCENRIKELKLDLASGRTSCHKFLANCFRLLLHALAFVLLSEVRRLLAGTALARATMGQIRLMVLKVGAIIQTSTRRTLIRLPRGHPHADILMQLFV
jgi:hypothetical protein